MYGIDKKVLYHHKVSAAKWSTTENSWSFDVEANGKPTKFRSRFMMLCCGYYDYHTPLQTEIPGLDKFQGTIVHPQFWPEDLDYSGKDVVVIGSGATAVTVLPVMAQTASHVTMVQRSPGYIVAVPSEGRLSATLARWFSWWPSLQHTLTRLIYVLSSLLITTLSAKYPEKTRQRLLERTEKLLPKSIPIDPNFTPSYLPWQQRLCLSPDGDFFDALNEGKASVETGHIETVTTNSIKMKSGKELRPDIIVTATGLKLQFAGGIKFTVDDKPYTVSEHYIWKGLMLEDLPNAAFCIGYVNASWTLGADASAQLVTRLIKLMRQDGAVAATPRTSETEKDTLKENNLLRLKSTYIAKAVGVNPKAGDSGQWVPRTHYLRDMWNAWYGDIRTNIELTKA